jgi:hypothetical protein
VDKEAEVMGEVVGRSIGDCENHDSFFGRALADVAVPCLTLFFVGSSAESTPMTPFVHLLAVFVNSDGALWAFFNGVAHFRVIAKTG